MKKRILSIGIAIVMLFAVVVLAACNGGVLYSGEIIGVNGGEFRVHFDRGVFFQDGTTRLISSRAELVELHIEQDIDAASENLFPEYSDDFFTTHQLVFVSFVGRPRDIATYEVGRMEYQDNTLTIEFVTTRRIGTVPDVGHTRTAIIEITRISDNLNVVFSHRDR